MNLYKLSAVLVACVAVTLSLSACASPVKSEAPNLSVSPTTSGTYDEWVYWTAEPRLDMSSAYTEKLHEMSELFGLGVVFEPPSDAYLKQGWAGVSQYGSLCIIALGIDGQSPVDGSVSFMVLSRYDQSLTAATEWSTDYDAIRTTLAPYTQWCQTGGPIPVPTEIENDPAEDAVTT